MVIDEPEPYVHEATLDTIRHWAHGIGCNDSRYTDPKYAESLGGLVAPPTFLYATSRIVSGYVGVVAPADGDDPHLAARQGVAVLVDDAHVDAEQGDPMLPWRNS